MKAEVGPEGDNQRVARPTDSCDCAGFCQEKTGCRGLPRRMAMHNHASSAEKAACLVCNPARTHWRDKVCVACKGPLPTPTWAGQPYICCSGLDCGCGGGTLPVEFCSVGCWENYEPEPDEPPEDDDELSDCHAFVDGGVFVCGAAGSEDCDECPFNCELGTKAEYEPEETFDE